MLHPRKDLLKKKKIKEDKFVTTTFLLWNKIQDNASTLTMVIGGIIVVGAIIFFISNMSKSSQEESRLRIVEAGNLVQINKHDEAIRKYSDIIEDYGGNEIAGLACFRLANLHFLRGEVDEAEKYFTLFLKKYDDEMLKCSASSGLAACLENKKQFLEAAQRYENTAYKYKESYLAPELLISAARCYKQENNYEKARVCYQEIIDNYAKSEYLRDAEVEVKMLIPNNSGK